MNNQLKEFKNRYGIPYTYLEVEPNVFKFIMDEKEMNYTRFGGLEGQVSIDCTNIGFFDPPGGPFVEVGSTIHGKKIKRISVSKEGIFCYCVES